MVRQVQGVIHGKTIELNRDLGIAEGQRVDVQVRRILNGHGLGEKVSYDRRASPRMFPASTRRSSRSSETASWPRCATLTNELPARYQHLLSSHPSKRSPGSSAGASVPSMPGVTFTPIRMSTFVLLLRRLQSRLHERHHGPDDPSGGRGATTSDHPTKLPPAVSRCDPEASPDARCFPASLQPESCRLGVRDCAYGAFRFSARGCNSRRPFRDSP